MKWIDMFCGIGGFRLGLEKANSQDSTDGKSRTSQYGECAFRCVWANEWDKYACQVYREQFGDSRKLGERTRSTECLQPTGDSPNSEGNARQGNEGNNWNEASKLYEGDITTVDPAIIPSHDLLCAGFPCQSFSIAGKRRGFQDTRGTLFFEICRILRAKGTPYVLLENVKGLLSHDDGDTFETILRTLDELGYDCQWQVLNSKDFGVPQNRERVFIIGHLRGRSRPKVFPIRELSEENNHLAGEARWANRSWCGALRESGTSSFGSGDVFVSDEAKIRRLTPTECERLQGFPDGWTEGISDTQRYKCLGNAVTVNVIEAIGRQFLETPNIEDTK